MKKIYKGLLILLTSLKLCACTLNTNENGIIIINGSNVINISWGALVGMGVGVLLLFGLATWLCIWVANKGKKDRGEK